MSATTMTQPASGQSLARGWSLFWNSADSGIRGMVLAFFGFFLAVALWKGATPSLYPLALGIWWMWVPRIALAHREARQENVPHIGGAVAWALLLALAPLLAAYLWSGNPVALLNAVFWSAMFLAVSLMSARKLMVAYMIATFVVAPIIVIAAFLSGVSVLEAMKTWLEGAPQMELIATSAAVAVSAAAWLWRRFLHRDIPKGESIWSKPLTMMTASNLRSAQVADQLWTGMPLSAWLLKEDRSTVSRSDVATMRRWIGVPFAPLTLRQQGMRLIASAVFVGWLSWQLGTGESMGQHRDFTMYFMALMVAVFGILVQRLHRFMQTPTTELAELALLPGWRDGANAKRLLLRAVWHAVRLEYVVVLVMTTMLLGAMWRLGAIAPAQAVGQMLLVVEVLILLHAALLAVLGGLRLRARPADLAVWCVAIAIPVGTMLYFGNHTAHWGALAAAWAAVLGGGGLLFRRLLAIYDRRPHPFLQP